jgi:hypothetical protein
MFRSTSIVFASSTPGSPQAVERIWRIVDRHCLLEPRVRRLPVTARERRLSLDDLRRR